MSPSRVDHHDFCNELAGLIEQVATRFSYPNGDYSSLNHLLRTDHAFQAAFLDLMRGHATIAPKD